MKIVEVHWVDPNSIFHQWTNVDDITGDDLKPKPCRNVGYVYRDDPDVLVLVASDGGDELGDGMVLPRGCIVSVTELAPAEPAVRAA